MNLLCHARPPPFHHVTCALVIPASSQNYLFGEGHAEGGSWWIGTVVADARLGRPHAEITNDPYGCGGLWERYLVQWDRADPSQSDPTVDAATDGRYQAEGDNHQLQERTSAAADVLESAAAGGAEGAVVNAVDGGGSSNSDESHSWLSPWELYEAGVRTDTVMIREHMTTITTEQV